jgi:hypothetical protein
MATFSLLANTASFRATLLPIIGTIDIDSVPAAITTSSSPVRMRSAASATACTPEEQKRLMVIAGTRVRQARQQHADARHVHALLRLGHRAADDHVADVVRVEPGHLRDRALQHVREHVVGPHAPEHAARRLAHGVRLAATIKASWICSRS